MLSLKSLIKSIETTCINHPEVETFGFGPITSFKKVPQLERGQIQTWLEPIGTQYLNGKNNAFIVRRFRLWCFDLVRRDELNEISVWSTTEGILIDLIKLIDNGVIKITNNPIIEPFSEFGEDDLWGNFVDIDLQTPETLKDC